MVPTIDHSSHPVSPIDTRTSCPYCSSELPPNAIYCPSCGEELGDTKSTVGLVRDSRRGRLSIQQEALTSLARSRELFQRDLSSALKVITRTAAGALDVERASVWLFNGDRTAIRCADLYELSSETHSSGAELARTDFPRYFEALERERQLTADDARANPTTSDLNTSYLEPQGIGAMLDAPVRCGGELVGVVCHEHVGEARHWAVDEQSFAASVADLVSLVIEENELHVAENALRSSEERFALAVRGSTDGLWDWDADGNVMWWSPRFYELLGVDQAEIEPSLASIRELCHPDDRDALRDHARGHLEHHEPFDLECRLRHQDGAYRCFRVRAQAIWDTEGEPQRMAGSIQDVTDRVDATEGLRFRVELERLTAEISTAFISLPVDETAAAIQEALGRVATFAGAAVASMSLADLDRRLLVWTFQWSEEDQQPLLPVGSEIPFDEVPWFTETLLAFEPFQIHSVEDIPPHAGRERQILEIIGPTTAVPIVLDGQLVGHLALSAWNNPVRWEEEIVLLLELVANVIGNAIARQRARRQQSALEAQLRQAQKMEAVGQLAGGIAHDFNNLLTVINSYAELAASQLEEGSSPARDLVAVRDAGRRAAQLTRQLLAFSRSQDLELEVVDLNRIIADLLEMLQRLLGDEITLETFLDPDLRAAKVDPVQIEQVLVNLIVNSRDAMPDGGLVTVVTANIERLDSATGRTEAFVRVSVTDEGTGIDKATQSRIFDPFFTTKPQGKGTGLGLATVFGIVTQCGGDVSVDSAEGAGTTFHIELPGI